MQSAIIPAPVADAGCKKPALIAEQGYVANIVNLHVGFTMGGYPLRGLSKAGLAWEIA